ncbi:MAG: hypothetical protein WA816_08050, partial [Bacteroidales bacterium]
MLTHKISKRRINKRKRQILISGFFNWKSKFILFLLLISSSLSCNKATHEVFTVMSGSFRQSIRQTGELEAVKASFIPMPDIDWQYGYQFKIIGLADHGKIVHKGDSLVKLDPASVYKFIIEREDMLENELADAKKQVVQSENNIQDLSAQL